MFKPFSFNWTDYPWQRFGLWAYNSIHLAVLSAGLATCAALIIGFYVRMFPDALSRGGARLVGMGYAVPGAVIVVGLLLPVAWLQKVAPSWGVGYWLAASILGLIWAYLVRFTAVALQSVESAYTRMPLHFDESAKVLGLGHLAIFRRVHWPLLKKSTGVAALLVFVDVMKELPATLVLRPFNYDTLAVVAYQLARDERLEEAALPSLALVLVGLLPVILLSRSLQAQKPGS